MSHDTEFCLISVESDYAKPFQAGVGISYSPYVKNSAWVASGISKLLCIKISGWTIWSVYL